MIMQAQTSVPANSVSANVLAGQLHEFLSASSVVTVYATGGAAGLQATLLVGGEAVVDDQEISSANRFPLVPDDFLVDHGGFAGDRLILKFRNTTGGAVIAFWRVEVEPQA